MAPDIAGLTDLVEVGRGGFGTVYRAEDPTHARTVAVKVLRQTLDRGAAARFERECRAAGSLSGHPNIVSTLGSGITDAGDPYLVMDFLPGGSLAERVATDGPLGAPDAIELGVGLAGALAAAHARGIVHRDVKPENVLYSAFGVPQLVDFGIARMASEFETRTASVSASLSHAPPEVIAGATPTPAGDLYSLASTLHFALSGKAPFAVDGETTLAPLIARISTSAPPDLRAAGVPDSLAAVVERALAKDPAERTQSAEAFGEELRESARTLGLEPPALRASSPAPAGPPPVETEPAIAPGPEPARRRPTTIVAAIAVAIFLVGGILIALQAAGGDDGSTDETGSTTTTVVSTTTTTPPGAAGATSAPTEVVVRNPTFLGGDTARVSVELSWKKPSDAPDGYRIRRQLHWNDKCGGPAGSDEAVVVDIEPTERTTQNADDTLPGCSWVSWEVAAVADGEAGTFVAAKGVVPDVVGEADSYHLVRAVGGLAAGPRDVRECGLESELACETSPSAGTTIEPGTIVAVYLQP